MTNWRAWGLRESNLATAAMSEDPAVRVVPGKGFALGQELVPIVSGSVHYWRLDPARWPGVLRAVRELGFGVIDTYVPWSVHETTRGEFDFSGAKDVEAFIRLAGELGLRVLVRPGPHINSELPDFGFPPRVLWDPQCQAHGPQGTPVIIRSVAHFFPAPSYCSPRFLDEVDEWYREIIPRLAALQWPQGPIIGCQVDNEMGYFFHLEPFLLDYRPEFVQAWRDFSERAGNPPVDGCEDPGLVESWVRFREIHIHQALARLGTRMRELGMSRIPLYHNDFTVSTTPLDPATLEASGAVEVAGADCYAQRENMAQAKLVARTLAGSSVLPFIPELGAGGGPDLWLFPLRLLPEDQEAVLLTVMLCGARAWNSYMLVERDRWYGSPISRNGEIRAGCAEIYARMNRMLAEIGWFDLNRVAPVVLLRNKDLERLSVGRQVGCEAGAILDDRQFPFFLRKAGFAGAAEAGTTEGGTDGLENLPAQFAGAWRPWLEARSLDFDEGSTDALGDLSRYELAVVCSADGFRPEVDHPRVITCLPSEDVVLPRPAFRHDQAGGISLHHFRSPAGREVLGALNVLAYSVQFHLSFDGELVLNGHWREERLEGKGGVDVTLPAYSGQVWEVTRR